MDPALQHLLREEAADRVIEAIIRLRHPRVVVPGVRIVARFARIATCRLRVGAVRRVWSHPDVASLKAARRLGPEVDPPIPHVGRGEPAPPRRPPGVRPTGAGVVIGVVDWGFDVDHPNLRHADGTTRVIALWDQRSAPPRSDRGRSPRPYGYGVVHSRARIDAALRTPNPFATLGYHPADADRGSGAHGTHVADIAAGRGAVGEGGVAPGAELVFVHLADRGTGGLSTMGDSVRLLEAVDFIARTAGRRPWVINLSMGRHGGPHDGTTLTELALDELISAAPGRFIAQSGGNYHQARAHAGGTIAGGGRRTLHLVTDPADSTANELEIWYPGEDELAVALTPPGASRDAAPQWVRLGEDRAIRAGGRTVGHVYHRAHDPNNGDHHIDAFLAPTAPAGTWQVLLEGRRITEGRFDAWVERDESCGRCQMRFSPDDAASDRTTGTIANGRLPLVTGAYDARSAARPPSRTSSQGPTRDGRRKPDVGAPGVAVRAARSAPAGAARSPGLLSLKTGTSMAAPHVTGAVALCLEVSGGALDARTIRRLVQTTAEPATTAGTASRLGAGYLNLPALLTAAAGTRTPTEGPEMSTEMNPEMNAETCPETCPGTCPDMCPESVTEPAPVSLPAPGIAFRELLHRPRGRVASRLTGSVQVLARPGERPQVELEAGDVVLQVVLGRRDDPGRQLRLTEAGLTRRYTNAVDARSGWYAAVSGSGADGVRVLDHTGRVPPGQLVVRPRGSEPTEAPLAGPDPASWAEDEPARWSGTPEQEDFRARVLAAHLARSRAAKGDPLPDLREDQLADVPGTCTTTRGSTTCVRTASATAAAAGRMLAAATADLATARAAGHPDALRTVRLTATSGYRGSDHQRRLWLGYFETKYYNESRAARAALADGPHSRAAVELMLRPTSSGGYGIGGRIAAPGYSNHQGGIAIDLWQERTRGNAIANDSGPRARCRWRQTWFHGWLRTHAAAFGFHPLRTEEWHWEYRPATGASTPPSTPQLSDHLGGRMWTFASAAMPHPVAVFCPRAALGRRDVDVLVFAHGLLGGCRRPRTLPSGFITDAPFRLGSVVDASGRPMVLVVPLLDWANPCGEVVFGRGQGRRNPLGHPAVLESLVGEVLTEVGRVQSQPPPALGELVLAGHSRAYDVLEPFVATRSDPAMSRPTLSRLRQVWAFDTTYAGDVAAWIDWLAADPARQLHVFYRADRRRGRDTGTVGDRFLARQGGQLHVTQVSEGHCAVPSTRLAQLLPPATPPARQPTGRAPETEDAELDPDLSATHGLEEE